MTRVRLLTTLFAALITFPWSTPLHAQDATAPTAPPADTTAEPAATPATSAPVSAMVTMEAAAEPTGAQEAPPETTAAPEEPAARPPTLTPLATGTTSGASASDGATTGTRSRFALYAVGDHRWNTSPAYDLYATGDATTLLGVTVGYDVVDITDVIALAAELGWSTGGTTRSGLRGGNIESTTLDTHQVHIAATARWQLLPWLSPHARMSVGASVVDMSLSSPADNVTFEDQTVAPFLGIGIGTSIQTRPGALSTKQGDFSSVQVGLRVEVGYTFSAKAGFSLSGDDSLRVPVPATALGSLPLSGAYLHTAAFVRL